MRINLTLEYSSPRYAGRCLHLLPLLSGLMYLLKKTVGIRVTEEEEEKKYGRVNTT